MGDYILPAGSLIGNNGRYSVKTHLGSGGFGITYLAEDTLLNINVAVKEFFPRNMAERHNAVLPIPGYEGIFAAGMKSFNEEAKLLASLINIPGVPHIRDTFLHGGTSYIVMDYIPGVSLSKYIENNGNQIGWIKTAEILAPIAAACKKLHEKNIVHRDITPANIIVADSGESKLIDFGSAVMPDITLKPGYAPIELYGVEVKVTAATDIYYLAATAYKCLTGKVPPAAADRAISDTLVPPSALGFNIPSTAEAILMQALVVKPEDRIQNDDEIIKMFSLTAETSNAEETYNTKSSSKTVGTLLFYDDAIVCPNNPDTNNNAQQKSETQNTPKPKPTEDTTDTENKETTKTEEITILRDCSGYYHISDLDMRLHDRRSKTSRRPNAQSAEESKRQAEEAKEKAKQQAEQAAKAAREAAGKAGEAAKKNLEKLKPILHKAQDYTRSHPKVIAGVAGGILLAAAAAAGGKYYYNNVYLNSPDKLYERACIALREYSTKNAGWALLLQAAEKGNEAAKKDITLMILLGSAGSTNTPYKQAIRDAVAYVDKGEYAPFLGILASGWYGFDTYRMQDYRDVISEEKFLHYVEILDEESAKNIEYTDYLPDLHLKIGNDLLRSGRERLDKDLVLAGLEHLRKSGRVSEEQILSEKENYFGRIDRELERQARREQEEARRAEREREREAERQKLREEAAKANAERERKNIEKKAAQQQTVKKSAEKKSTPAQQSTTKPAVKKTPVKQAQPKQTTKQTNRGMTLTQKVATIRTEMAKRDAAEQARLRARAEKEAAAKGISVNDALLQLLGILK